MMSLSREKQHLHRESVSHVSTLEAYNQAIHLDPATDIAYLIKKHLHELLATQAHEKAKEISAGKQRVYVNSRHFIVNVEDF